MTGKKNSTATRRAARTVPQPPAPTATPPSGATAGSGPLGAVRAALAASPDGAATAAIAAAAAVSRPTAGKALTELEAAGEAQRGKGTGRGSPAIWRPATPAGSTGPAGGTAAASATGTPAGSPHDTPAGTGTPGDAPQTDGESTPADAPAGVTPPQAEPATTGDGTADPEPAAAPDGAAGTAPEAPVAAQVSGHAAQISAAAQQVATVLAEGDLRAALAGVEEVCEQATQARRALKTALSGRKAPTVKGGLRDLVAAHLAAHPGAAFTPHEIGKVLGRSSGAVANALDKLVSHGQATLANEKPRRFQHATPATTGGPAPAAGRDAGAEPAADAA